MFRWSLVFPVALALPALLLGLWGERMGLGPEFADRAGTPDFLGYLLLGALYWNFVEVVWSLVFSLRQAMRQGMLESLLSTGISRAGLIGAWSGSRFAVEVIPSLATLGLILALSGVPPWPRWGGVVAVWILSLGASYGFAFLLFGLTLRFKDAESIISILGNTAPLLGGVFFPIALLPTFLQPLSYVFPFAYGADAVRALWLGTPAMFPMGLQVGLLGVMAVAYVVLGWWALVYFERRARHHGLEGF
jgi:ABC-2 type transport system permease protein